MLVSPGEMEYRSTARLLLCFCLHVLRAWKLRCMCISLFFTTKFYIIDMLSVHFQNYICGFSIFNSLQFPFETFLPFVCGYCCMA